MVKSRDMVRAGRRKTDSARHNHMPTVFIRQLRAEGERISGESIVGQRTHREDIEFAWPMKNVPHAP